MSTFGDMVYAMGGVPCVGGVEVPLSTGTYFFVDSVTGNNGNTGRTLKTPVATIDYAIGLCTANKGDVIIVMPGHVDTISAASGITVDVAGITIVGLGNGLARPTITLNTSAAASIVVSAANVTIKNLIFTANFADIATCFTISAKDCRIEGCSFLETAVNMNFLSCILTNATNNAADGLAVVGNERISVDAAALAFISILANITRLTVTDNFDNQSSAADVGHFIIMGAFVCLGVRILRNTLNLNGDNNAQTVGVFATGSSTTSTGIMAYNLVMSLDTTTELMDTATLDFGHFENYYTGVIATSGKLWPVVDVA